MKEQRIIIDINPDGQLSAEADGFAGDTCLTELARLLEGMPVEAGQTRRKLPDAAMRQVNQQELRRKP